MFYIDRLYILSCILLSILLNKLIKECVDHGKPMTIEPRKAEKKKRDYKNLK